MHNILSQLQHYFILLQHCFIFLYVIVSIITNLGVKCEKVEEKPQEMFDRALPESEARIAECESNLTTFFCLFLTVCF